MYKGEKSNHVKIRCDEIGMTLRVVFWICLLLSILYLGIGIFLALKPASEFSVSLMETSAGFIGIASAQEGSNIQFAVNVLNSAAIERPKLVYCTGYFVQWAANLTAVAILWYIRNIFRNIEKRETPFLAENSRAVRAIGILVIVNAHIKTAFLPLFCAILGIGAGGSEGMINVSSLLVGGVIICLSYIFAYGAVLQTEVDETI